MCVRVGWTKDMDVVGSFCEEFVSQTNIYYTPVAVCAERKRGIPACLQRNM